MVTSHEPTRVFDGQEATEVVSGPQPAVKYVVEAIGTFFLVFTVGAISGGAFNPAVTLGAAVMGMFAWPTLWVYLAAQVIGGLAAGVTFLALNPDDK